MNKFALSVVVATRNEADNVASCIDSFAAFRDRVEIVVVDNDSSDSTCAIAAERGAMVLRKGPERCAQRNSGWQNATADWILILDADMIVPGKTIAAILEATGRSESNAPAAYWIPEIRSGRGFRAKVRNFERSFYDATCIDALRLFRRDVLEKTGGYDEKLLPGGEDWELDIRVKALSFELALLSEPLIHNEKQLPLKRMLEKKAYYTRGFAAYKAKWPDNPAVKKQFSPWYRFAGVFIEHGKWRKVLRHPILFAGIIFERLAVGMVYLRKCA